MLTDRIDGDLARSRGLVTNVGKVLDPIADKALVTMALVGLSIIGEVWWWVTDRRARARVGHHRRALLGDPARRHGRRAGRQGQDPAADVRHRLLPDARGGPCPFPDFWDWVAAISLGAAVVVTVVTGIDYLAPGAAAPPDERAGSPQARRAGGSSARLAAQRDREP